MDLMPRLGHVEAFPPYLSVSSCELLVREPVLETRELFFAECQSFRYRFAVASWRINNAVPNVGVDACGHTVPPVQQNVGDSLLDFRG
jgi:hypothetical protein